MKLKLMIFPALLLAFCNPGRAGNDPHTSNPASPYPPACISSPLRSVDLTGENVVRFFSGRIRLETTHRIENSNPMANLGEVLLYMYRVGCSEPGRSVIVAEFRLTPEWVDPRNARLILPSLAGEAGFDVRPLVFKSEPNSWDQGENSYLLTGRAFGDYTGGWDNPRDFTWRYVLDTPAGTTTGDRNDPPGFYNARFDLVMFKSNGEKLRTIPVPATDALSFRPKDMPLSGRLSGNWIEQGSADQGLLLAFNTPPPRPGAQSRPETTELQVFMSWFTFDADGELLWLTGAAWFEQGASEVSIPIERVSQGSFLDSRAAHREIVGSVRLRAHDCDWLEFDYNLDVLGLGSDVMDLNRLFSLEVADYPCRDYEGLQTGAFPVQSN